MGSSVNFWLILILCNSATSGWYIKVRVHDDNGTEVESYEQEFTENDLHEQPPFIVPPETAEHERKRRYRRAYGDSDSSSLNIRSEPACSKQMKEIRMKAKNQPIQLAYVAELGEDVKLMCHYCGHPEDWYKVMVWKRLLRRGNTRGKFWIVPVRADMHDDEERNRITFSFDHSLVIKNITEDITDEDIHVLFDTDLYGVPDLYPMAIVATQAQNADADTYFCHNYQTEKVIEEEMDNEGMRRMFEAKDKFRYYYHLDVVRTANIPARMGKQNFMYVTNWAEWSPCSVCGQPGERRRHGVCTVKLLDKDKITDPPVIYYALRSFAMGMPCRSTMFHGNEVKIPDRPDEIMVEPCTVICKGFIRNGTFTKVTVEKIEFGVERTVLERKVNVTINSKINMDCPGATLDDMVYWINNSNYISSTVVGPISGGRAEIDAYGVLRIRLAQTHDSGTYHCWYREKKRVTYYVNVYNPVDPETWDLYLKYLMLCYTVDFWIFLALMWVKHKYRQVQVSNVYWKTGKDDSVDDTGSDETSSGDTSSTGSDTFSTSTDSIGTSTTKSQHPVIQT